MVDDNRKDGRLLDSLLPIFEVTTAVLLYRAGSETQGAFATRLDQNAPSLARAFRAAIDEDPLGAGGAALARAFGGAEARLVSGASLRGTALARCIAAMRLPQIVALPVFDRGARDVRAVLLLGRTLEQPVYGAREGHLAEYFLPWLELAVAPSAAPPGEDGIAANGLDHVQDNGSLSKRELEIAIEAARGARNREIATALYVTEATVRSHLRRIFRKLGVRSRGGILHALTRTPVSPLTISGEG